jgi:hypothetical protein
VAFRNLSTSSIISGYKSSKLWDQSTLPGFFESISTVYVASAQSSVVFTNIPQTYKHLQLRVFARSSRSAAVTDLQVQINGVTSSNYRTHALYGVGSGTGLSYTTASQPIIYFGRVAANTSPANTMGGGILDLIDYTSSNKYKTLRWLGGADANGSGEVYLSSGFLTSSLDPISSITLTSYDTVGTPNWLPGSHFALYGIRG